MMTAPRTRALQLLAIVAFVAWFFTLRPAFLGGSASFIIVSGISMEPTFQTGDLVILRREARYAVGQVVAFQTDGGPVIHRVIGGDGEHGYVTQGDNKDAPDPWKPTAAQVLGREWLAIPGGGTFFQPVNYPERTGLVASVLTGILLYGRRARRRRRFDAEGHRTMRRLHAPQLTPPASGRGATIAALALLGTLALAFLAGAVAALRQPAQEPAFVERASFEQQAVFDYTVHAEPSILYPDGTLGPDDVAPVSESGERMPLFTTLIHTIDIVADWQLAGGTLDELTGEQRVDLRIAALDGWTHTLPLAEPRPLGGVTDQATATLDLAEINTFISAVEEETGYQPGGYTLTVIPRWDVTATIAGEPVTASFAPEFPFTLNGTQLAPAGELEQRLPSRLGETRMVAGTLELPLLGSTLERGTLLGVSLIGLLLSLAGLGWVSAVGVLGVGRREPERIRTRYGAMVIDVARFDLGRTTATIEVATIEDLARLAKRDGGVMFRETNGAGDSYFVPDGATLYRYRVSDRPGLRGVAPEPEGTTA